MQHATLQNVTAGGTYSYQCNAHIQKIKGWHKKRLSQLAEAVKHLTCVWEVPKQDFTCATDYFDRGFLRVLHSFHANAKIAH